MTHPADHVASGVVEMDDGERRVGLMVGDDHAQTAALDPQEARALATDLMQWANSIDGGGTA